VRKGVRTPIASPVLSCRPPTLALAVSGAQKRRDTSPCRQFDRKPFDDSSAKAGSLMVPTASIPIASQRWMVLDEIFAAATVLTRSALVLFHSSKGGDAVTSWYRMQRCGKQRLSCTEFGLQHAQGVC
jgi:hypothetical protein